MPTASLPGLPEVRALFGLRQRAMLGLAIGVALGHALLLGQWPALPGSASVAPRALQVRQIVRPTAVPEAPPAAAAAQARRLAAPAASPRDQPAAVLPPQASSQVTQAPTTAPDTAPAEPSSAPGGRPVPVYATRLPPAVTLAYEMRRGSANGRAELSWHHADGRYLLTLSSRAPGAQAVGSISQGRLDAHGLAPERYTESRRGRDLRAVNFQREAGRITFSGPRAEYPWIPGAQDRLSWMLQLAAVVDADAALQATDGEIALFVVGTRGDAEVWPFVVLGRETTELAAGAVAGTLHLRRESQRPYDPQVDIWLDPARHHLPVRMLLLLRQTAGSTEFLLDSLSSP